jgi:hypothetical protein
MARPRCSWASSAFAPWWLGLLFTISISADAGQGVSSGASISPLSARAPQPPDVLVPPTISAAASGDFGRLTGEAERLLRAASLVIDDPATAMRLSTEIEPRAVSRRRGAPLPVIDRRTKSGPFVGIRPTFETGLRGPGALARLQLHEALFEGTGLVGSFSEVDAELPMFEPSCTFIPWPEGESPTAVQTRSATSPQGQGVTTLTMRPAALQERLLQGATPFLSRAERLASLTPAQADLTPVEIVAHAMLPPSATHFVPRDPIEITPPTFTLPAYTLPARRSGLDKERRCLAEAIYFEARGESEEGQAAVAQVVLNRVSSGVYPATICGVVYQNRHRLNACQFSFACDGRRLRVDEPSSWRTAVRIATEVTSGKTYVSDVGSSTHYHAAYVRPRWASKLEKMDVIGQHIFYKLHPGQN